MGLEDLALIETHGFPIRHEGEVHDGKVRSVYWLTSEDSRMIIDEEGYDEVSEDTQLGFMVISDRVSAFNVPWKSEDGLGGVPGKGAALNAISALWFDSFDVNGLAGNHIVDRPHPLMWLVQRAQPVMVEAIARQYITGSMWRAYERGERVFCGIELPHGLQKNHRLSELLITPTTKGILRGIPGVPEEDDIPITRQQILENYRAFGFKSEEDVELYETLLRHGFAIIDKGYEDVGRIHVDTKFEFGYVEDVSGDTRMIYIDEVGTLDSSRVWPAGLYSAGRVIEESKEELRKWLLNESGIEKNLLLSDDDESMARKKAIAAEFEIPYEVMMRVSKIYTDMVERLTEEKLPQIGNVRSEIMDVVNDYGVAT
jgi:phosphoribosylaminoimidazole-succinocarboxamide synthase